MCRAIGSTQHHQVTIRMQHSENNIVTGQAPGGNRTHASAIPRRQAPATTRGQRFLQSAQWESNPHIRHGKATGSRYIMGASIIIQCIRWDLHPRHHFGRVVCSLLHHGCIHTVEAAGIEPTSCRLRGGCLANFGHTSSSGPEGIRTPDLLRDKETATPLARGTVVAVHQRAPRAGVEPDLCGLKNRRPHPKSNEALIQRIPVIIACQTRTGRGIFGRPPAGA